MASNLDVPINPPEKTSVEELEELDDFPSMRNSNNQTSNDYEKILSIQFMINFDQIFISDYKLKESTLSSIELMKQKIEQKFGEKNRRYSQSDITKEGDSEKQAERNGCIY